MRNPHHITVTKKQAERMTRAVDEQVKSMETSWAQLGKMIDACLKKNVPAALNLSAQQWMEKRMPFSTTKGWRALRITRKLEGVPKKQMQQLTEGNAVALSRLPERQRKSKVWVTRAIETPNEKFKEEVATELAEKEGVKREEFVTLRIALPRSIFDKFDAAFKKLARVCNIDIEHFDGRRIQVYERIADLIDGINEETLVAAIEGGE